MKEDWIQVDIENIFKKLENGKRLNQGWSPQCKNYPSPSEDVWGVLKTTAIQKNEFWGHENKELPKDKEVRSHLEVKTGDILLTCAGPRNRCGVVCTVKKTRPKLLISGKIYRFRPDERVMTTKFLTFQLQTQESWLSIDKMKTGTSDSGLNLTHSRFKKLPVRIAPLSEQDAIVARIEELFSDLDQGIADLKKAQDQLKIYRQALLKKAFEGDLTKEWREKQTNLPSADMLLKQINEERKQHYHQQLEEWEKALRLSEKNENSKKPSKPKKLINYPKIEQTNSLPIMNLGELVFQISNKMMPNEAPDFPFIGMDCLEKNALKPHFTYKFKEFKSAGNWFNTNHVLYGRLRPYLNKVYRAEYEGVASGEFIILETIKSFDSNYLKLILHQQDFVHWANNQSAGDKPRVKFDQIALFQIKLPTIKEQQKIVQEVESHLSVCDKVEESISESLEKSKVLRQSILKKAFEGKLLSAAEIAKCKQAKDYEPASLLLERIKREKNG